MVESTEKADERRSTVRLQRINRSFEYFKILNFFIQIKHRKVKSLYSRVKNKWFVIDDKFQHLNYLSSSLSSSVCCLINSRCFRSFSTNFSISSVCLSISLAGHFSLSCWTCWAYFTISASADIAYGWPIHALPMLLSTCLTSSRRLPLGKEAAVSLFVPYTFSSKEETNFSNIEILSASISINL
ncbi:hypothetical protein AGLY_008349 [Aphis glycines]|uniref:Uncharacterized protein n=1 Tax=Aphis glycines TaxID=307491 RepID=A0A6G0TM54_APHGL|nr:hypothetical protein AGLY_008349 [Aphis glycines]